MKENKRGINLFVLVIIIVLMAVLVVGVILLKNKKNISEEINLTNEEKENLNYEELLEDIEATKRGNYPVHAEYKESKWVGDGYTITFRGGFDITDYEVYYGDKLICTYTYTHPLSGEEDVMF